MKQMLTVVVLFILQNLSAQSVLGIKFGSDFYQVKSQLERRFGTKNTWEADGAIIVDMPKIGEIRFEAGIFDFQSDEKSTYFNYAQFYLTYDEDKAEKAQDFCDYIFKLLSDKYNDKYAFSNKEGFRCYGFGVNPKNPSNTLGMILINRCNEKGNVKLCVTLHYGPIYYIDKASDF